MEDQVVHPIFYQTGGYGNATTSWHKFLFHGTNFCFKFCSCTLYYGGNLTSGCSHYYCNAKSLQTFSSRVLKADTREKKYQKRNFRIFFFISLNEHCLSHEVLIIIEICKMHCINILAQTIVRYIYIAVMKYKYFAVSM